MLRFRLKFGEHNTILKGFSVPRRAKLYYEAFRLFVSSYYFSSCVWLKQRTVAVEGDLYEVRIINAPIELEDRFSICRFLRTARAYCMIHTHKLRLKMPPDGAFINRNWYYYV